MSKVAICNKCLPQEWAANTTEEMHTHLKDVHNTEVKDDFDLLDYFTNEELMDRTYRYMGMLVKVPNKIIFVGIENSSVRDAARSTLFRIRNDSGRYKNAKILAIRRHTSPLGEEDMKTPRRKFFEDRNAVAMANSVRTHTQRMAT